MGWEWPLYVCKNMPQAKSGDLSLCDVFKNMLFSNLISILSVGISLWGVQASKSSFFKGGDCAGRVKTHVNEVSDDFIATATTAALAVGFDIIKNEGKHFWKKIRGKRG